MTINIQQMIYDELKGKIFRYPVYTCPNDSMKIPYIVIENISTSKLPYSQESHKYEEVDVMVTIYDKSYSNKNCLDALDKAKEILDNLPYKFPNISNLSITTETQHNKNSFSANLKLNFYCVS